jgi:hypothetical protein
MSTSSLDANVAAADARNKNHQKYQNCNDDGNRRGDDVTTKNIGKGSTMEKQFVDALMCS